MMNIRKIVLGLTAGLLIFSACNNDDPESLFSEYSPESFPDLTLNELSQIETPFESVLVVNNPGGRVSSHHISIADLAAQLEAIFSSSTVIEIDEGIYRGLEVWFVEIIFDNGAFLEIVIDKEFGKILEAEGQFGPFDFSFVPGGQFISMEEAIDAALTAVPGEVVRVELELEEDNKWEYEIHIENADGKWEVEVDAFTGEVIQIKQIGNEHDDEFDHPGESAPQEILDIALDMVPGSVVHSELKEHDERSYYKIVIETENGAHVKLKLGLDGSLIMIKSEDGPFNYVVEPGNGLITFLEAKEIALSEVEGEIEAWKLRLKETDEALIWVYQFEILLGDQEYEVKVDALTGMILEVETEEDDEDDDEVNDDEGDDEVGEVPADVLNKATAIVAGDVIKAEKEMGFWEIYILTEAGSVVEVELKAETLDLVSIEGEEPPYEYEVNPGGDFITFSMAKAIVTELADGEIHSWEFEMNDTEIWVYEFKMIFNQDDFKITIDAVTGDEL